MGGWLAGGREDSGWGVASGWAGGRWPGVGQRVAERSLAGGWLAGGREGAGGGLASG